MTAEVEIERGRLDGQVPARGTQSFLHTLGYCWRRPSLLGLEFLWRWSLGIPVLALLSWEITRILASVPLDNTGIQHFSLLDTVGSAQILSAAADMLWPPVRAVAFWLLPLLAIAWAVASGLGRTAVLRRYDATLYREPFRMVGLQLLRIGMLGSSFGLWFLCLHWAAWTSLSGPAPNLVGYFVKAIFLSLAMFCFWAAAGWVFSIAPLLVALQDAGMIAAIRESLGLGHGSLRGLRPKLVEINLVLGIVKAALIVLAMVFCATPMPFKEEINGNALYGWWAFVTVMYFAASDFFQLARVIGFVQLWRAAHPGEPVLV
ncbi:MAG TPA: hypothetical protein VFN53_08665 [Acidobacteriaceae bacterium]|nr:hypothetical protein [Acidobacteriaceae bacterium]